MSAVASGLLKQLEDVCKERDLHIRASELLSQEIENLVKALQEIAGLSVIAASDIAVIALREHRKSLGYSNAANAPTMTDLMVDPATLDTFMEANPLPDDKATIRNNTLDEAVQSLRDWHNNLLRHKYCDTAECVEMAIGVVKSLKQKT